MSHFGNFCHLRVLPKGSGHHLQTLFYILIKGGKTGLLVKNNVVLNFAVLIQDLQFHIQVEQQFNQISSQRVFNTNNMLIV